MDKLREGFRDVDALPPLDSFHYGIN
jgi:hypothetical protein